VSRAAFEASLRRVLAAWDLALADAQVELLWRHFERLLEANRSFNLTRVTDPAVAACQLFADSLAAVLWAEQTGRAIKRVADIGTGAGFPAVPIAVARPDWAVFALDGTGKKARFVAESAAALALGNVTAIHSRAEDWKPPQPIDLVLAKAVGPLADCVSFAAPLSRPGTTLLVYKTPAVSPAEFDAGLRAAASAGFASRAPLAYGLDAAEGPIHRVLHVFEKCPASSTGQSVRRRHRRFKRHAPRDDRCAG